MRQFNVTSILKQFSKLRIFVSFHSKDSQKWHKNCNFNSQSKLMNDEPIYVWCITMVYPNTNFRCTGWSKILCAPDDYSTKNTVKSAHNWWFEDGHHRICSECGLCYTEHGLWEQFSVSINVWRLARDTFNVTCDFMYCNQWHTQDFFRRGGVQQIQLRTEGRENGDLGAVAPSSGVPINL
jgi:hypothetical protein